MGDISSLEHCCETHAVTGAVAFSEADMVKATVVWTCTLLISLWVDSCHAQKLNIHWGPQSMMYLKGKYGRRFVSEDDNSVQKKALQAWYAVLRGTQRLQTLELSKPSHLVSSEKVLIHSINR